MIPPNNFKLERAGSWSSGDGFGPKTRTCRSAAAGALEPLGVHCTHFIKYGRWSHDDLMVGVCVCFRVDHQVGLGVYVVGFDWCEDLRMVVGFLVGWNVVFVSGIMIEVRGFNWMMIFNDLNIVEKIVVIRIDAFRWILARKIFFAISGRSCYFEHLSHIEPVRSIIVFDLFLFLYSVKVK